MTITLTPELEQEFTKLAQEQGTTPEAVALGRLRHDAAPAGASQPFEPQDDWERELMRASSFCGVSLSNEAVSSEGIYE